MFTIDKRMITYIKTMIKKRRKVHCMNELCTLFERKYNNFFLIKKVLLVIVMLFRTFIEFLKCTSDD